MAENIRFDSDNPPESKKDKSESVLSESLLLLVKEFTRTTNYSKRDIKYISYLQSNPFYYRILKNFVENKKHLKGNYGKQLIKVIGKLADALAAKMSLEAFKDAGLIGFQKKY